MATTSGSFAFTPIRGLAALIAERRASPVEVAEYFLARLETLGPDYNAVAALAPERALATARRAESEIANGAADDGGGGKNLLRGVPWGAKDLLATSGGIPTTWGAPPFASQRFDYDATVVTRLESAGAPMAAKLAMIELAGGMGYNQPNASLTGPPRNPWNPERWTGGSSSGSGAAVCAGLVPFAIGSETFGSILSPSNNCGLSGLRPTYGRVSRYGAMALCWTLDKLGPICLTADDCGIVLDAIAGQDGKDSTATPRAFAYDPDFAPRRAGGKFRIGVLRDVDDGAQDAVKANFRAALEALSDIADVEEVILPDLPYVEVTRTILMVEAASAFEDFLADGGPRDLVAPEDRWGPYARTAILATDYVKALRLRGCDSARSGRRHERVRRVGGADFAIRRHADRRAVPPNDGGARRRDGRCRQRLRAARAVRPQRLRRRRAAHRDSAHVPRLRRKRLPRHRKGVPSANGLAYPASGGLVGVTG